jgi:hypothetical protein
MKRTTSFHGPSGRSRIMNAGTRSSLAPDEKTP